MASAPTRDPLGDHLQQIRHPLAGVNLIRL
jgi:hypothetical protein